MKTNSLWGAALVAALVPGVAQAQTSEVDALRAELARTKADLVAHEQRLRALEARLAAVTPKHAARIAASDPTSTSIQAPAPAARTARLETVGAPPEDFDQPPAVAVLGDQGSVITRRGQLTTELQLEYARADRNRALFRGIEVVESVLIGVFDINESRQDLLTAALSARYGVSNRFEVGVRVPFVHRNDVSVLAPVQGSTNNDAAATIDNSASGTGIGDVELTMRYQLTRARAGKPFLIGNLQVVAPTGSNPFEVPRDESGRMLKAATGAGFWGVSPSLTAILPTDPAVLFGSLGYTRNFGANVNTTIPPVRITRVKPGDSVSFSAGIGVSLNERVSLNLGYAHTWAFGTKTRTILLDPSSGNEGPMTQSARDLQIGRLLFGVSYRVSDRTSINWSVEAGATDDAADVRTVLRIPFLALTGS